jgi:hypothetical protein
VDVSGVIMSPLTPVDGIHERSRMASPDSERGSVAALRHGVRRGA